MNTALRLNEVRYEQLKGGEIVGYSGSFLGYDQIQVKLPSGKIATIRATKYNMIITFDNK